MTTASDSRGSPATPGPIQRGARCVRVLACAWALGASSAGASSPESAEAAAPSSTTVEGTAPAAESIDPYDPENPGTPPWTLRLGVELDAGAPDGIGAAVLANPLRWLRLHAGATTNTLGLGVRGGADLIPFDFFISPTLSLDVGHYFSADYGKLLSRLGGQSSGATTLLRDIHYNYATANVGLELSPLRFLTLFLRGGLSYWSFEVKDVNAYIQDVADDSDITAAPLSIRFTSPSLKLGLILYFM